MGTSMATLQELATERERNDKAYLNGQLVMDAKQDLVDQIQALKSRLKDCEQSLKVWDDGGDSEYWVRYGHPSN